METEITFFAMEKDTGLIVTFWISGIERTTSARGEIRACARFLIS